MSLKALGSHINWMSTHMNLKRRESHQLNLRPLKATEYEITGMWNHLNFTSVDFHIGCWISNHLNVPLLSYIVGVLFLATSATAKIDAEKAARTAGKGMGERSLIVLEVKPFDAEKDFQAIARGIKSIEREGIQNWGRKHKLQPVAFGVFKLAMEKYFLMEFGKTWKNLIVK